MTQAERNAAESQLYAVIDRATRSCTGLKEISQLAAPLIADCIEALGPVFGVPLSRMALDEEPPFDYPGAMIAIWKRKGFSPAGVLRALRRAPSVFARYPTSGMLESVIRNGPITGWPAEYLKSEGAQNDKE